MFEKHPKREPFLSVATAEETLLCFRGDPKGDTKGQLCKELRGWVYRTPWDNTYLWTAKQLRQIADKLDQLNGKGNER